MSYTTRFLRVHPIPLLTDNYSYLLTCLRTQQSAVVDVADGCAQEVQASLTRWIRPEDVQMLFTTHKHYDHSGGNTHMQRLFPHLRVIAGEHEEGIQGTVHERVADGTVFSLGDLRVRVLHTPGHTRGHVLYHAFHPDESQEGVLFTGDTLFIGGCGRTFEGTAAQMVQSLRRIFSEVPLRTRVFCGHEYTLMFMKRFAHLEESNEGMRKYHAWVIEQREKGATTMGSPLEEEKVHNMYIRAILGLWRTPDVVAQGASEDETAVLQFLKVYNTPR